MFYYFLHFDLSETMAFARYLPITPALPVTSETCSLPLDYSTSEWCGEDASSRVELIGVAGVSANFSGIEVVNLTLLSNLCPS